MSELTVLGADAGEIAPLRLPEPARVFDARARRFSALARDHAAAPFLELLAAAARGQGRAARQVRIPAGARLLEGFPLDAPRWARDPAWREMLRLVLAASRDAPLPAPAREVVERLEGAPAAELEALAADVLAGTPRDLASAPFVGAALQAYFTCLAAGLDAASAEPAGAGCPVCGSPPVAAVVLGTERTRHLACSLCATEWHVPRVQCFICRSAATLSYFSVEGGPAGSRAEACESCRSYLKVFDRLEAPAAEPLADDAATLVLDLLMGERGYRRAGLNLLAPAREPS